MPTPKPLTLRDGRVLEAWIEGEGRNGTLVFHNGTPSSGLPYQPDLDALAARGIRWVSWSRPGYGDSTRQPGRSVGDLAADAREILDQLGVDRAYVAGWSGGGADRFARTSRTSYYSRHG